MSSMPKFLVLLLLASAPASVAADDAPELTVLLNEFLSGASVDDRAAHERFWADDLIYTSSGGERIGKADILRELSTTADTGEEEPATTYRAEDIRIQQYGDTAIVAFRLVGSPAVDAEVGADSPQGQAYYNTGTFLRREGRWQAVAWQATRIPAVATPLVADGQCPPSGYTREQLFELKQNDFAVPDAEQRQALAVGLMDCLADPDPAMRDGVVFEGVSGWMRSQQLSSGTVLILLDHLQGQIQSSADPNGFQQPFAALLLAEVARVDRLENIMTAAQREMLVGIAVNYLAGVKDYRGFSSTEGWRHGVAHGSDLVVQLALNPSILPGQVEQLMTAVATQVAPGGEVFYVYGEPGRLARAVYYAWSRGLAGAAFWDGWFAGIADPQPLANWAGSFSSQTGLAKRHNTLSFLLALHFNALLAGDEAGDALAGQVAHAIAQISGG